MPKLLTALFPAAVLGAACAGAWAQAGPSYPAPPDPFLEQPISSGQPPVPNGEQAYGKVISVTPAYRQISTPQQVCNDQQVYTGQRTSGMGALAGAVVGGVLGNGIGHGFGRAAATGAGVFAGSAIGNQLEGGVPSYQRVRQCTTQYVTQDQPDGYNVEYEYAGRRYHTHTDSSPGTWLPLTVSVQPTPPQEPYPAQPYADAAPGYAVPQPGVVVGTATPVAMVPPPVMVAPAYYAPPVAVQPVIQLGIGGYWGGGHRHWR